MQSDFWVEKETRPVISTLSSRAKTQLQPMSGAYNLYHLLVPNKNGKISVTGTGFPSNSWIYVLLYRLNDSNSSEMVLISKQVVLSAPNGLINTELSGRFEAGQLYLLVGLSNPNTPLEINNIFNWELPIDTFQVEWPSSSFVAPNSCPGAPLQRMIVNQRGYVCTKGDSVRLRNDPFRSASTIVSLPVGSQFTVLGGPSCADNWSWWKIQTDNGYSGWISEGGDEVDPYFICPLP
jgi:hypothetical protein